jgi:hypothetical protein
MTVKAFLKTPKGLLVIILFVLTGMALGVKLNEQEKKDLVAFLRVL